MRIVPAIEPAVPPTIYDGRDEQRSLESLNSRWSRQRSPVERRISSVPHRSNCPSSVPFSSFGCRWTRRHFRPWWESLPSQQHWRIGQTFVHQPWRRPWSARRLGRQSAASLISLSLDCEIWRFARSNARPFGTSVPNARSCCPTANSHVDPTVQKLFPESLLGRNTEYCRNDADRHLRWCFSD